jgi:hypothetical protein
MTAVPSSDAGARSFAGDSDLPQDPVSWLAVRDDFGNYLVQAA